jgi:predicted nuclease with TOPRIM domain
MQEMKELQALAYRDTTQENRDFWKNEMGGALRDIQKVYEDKIDEMRDELEKYYNMKIQEFRTGTARQNIETVHAKEESKKLRDNLSDLRKRLADAEARVCSSSFFIFFYLFHLNLSRYIQIAAFWLFICATKPNMKCLLQSCV